MINPKNTTTIEKYVRKYILEIMLVVLVIIMSFASKKFLSTANFLNILKNMSLQGILAFGMTMVIIGGEIDLSISSTVAITGVIVGLSCGKFAKMGLSMIPGFVTGLLLSLLLATTIGLINTFFITKYRLPAMIVTIAMQYIIYGVASIISGGFPVISFPSWYSMFGSGIVYGFPVMAIFLLAMFCVVSVIMNYTKLGRAVYAVGGNMESARLSGISVIRTKIFIMIAIQVCAVISGVLVSSQVMSGSFTFGKGWEFTAIASSVIGGTSFGGGVGRVWGTFIGLAFLGVLLNALVLLNVNEYVQYIVRGGLILFAVVVNSFNKKKVS